MKMSNALKLMSKYGTVKQLNDGSVLKMDVHRGKITVFARQLQGVSDPPCSHAHMLRLDRQGNVVTGWKSISIIHSLAMILRHTYNADDVGKLIDLRFIVWYKARQRKIIGPEVYAIANVEKGMNITGTAHVWWRCDPRCPTDTGIMMEAAKEDPTAMLAFLDRIEDGFLEFRRWDLSYR